jgi:hypothetical protein
MSMLEEIVTVSVLAKQANGMDCAISLVTNFGAQSVPAAELSPQSGAVPKGLVLQDTTNSLNGASLTPHSISASVTTSHLPDSTGSTGGFSTTQLTTIIVDDWIVSLTVITSDPVRFWGTPFGRVMEYSWF